MRNTVLVDLMRGRYLLETSVSSRVLNQEVGLLTGIGEMLLGVEESRSIEVPKCRSSRGRSETEPGQCRHPWWPPVGAPLERGGGRLCHRLVLGPGAPLARGHFDPDSPGDGNELPCCIVDGRTGRSTATLARNGPCRDDRWLANV